jgi:hypothetical protein
MAWSRNRAVRLTVNLLVFGFCGAALLTYLRDIEADLRQVQFQPWWMVAAWVLTWLIVWTGAAAWWLLLRGFRQPVGLAESMHAHLKSAVARYVPGFAWQYIGKAYLTARMGVSPKVVSLLLVWEVLQLVWAGMIVGLLFVPFETLEAWGLGASRPAWVGLGVAMLLAGLLFPILGPKTVLRRLLGNQPVCSRYLLLSFLTILLNWLVLGLAFCLTVLALGFGSLRAYPFFTFTFSSSLVIGLLALPVPNGLGVREAIMAFLLGQVMPVPVAVLASGVSRLEILVGELVSVLASGIFRRLKTQKTGDHAVREEYF